MGVGWRVLVLGCVIWVIVCVSGLLCVCVYVCVAVSGLVNGYVG